MTDENMSAGSGVVSVAALILGKEVKFMDSGIVVAIIGAAVTIGNVLLTNLLSNRKRENEREKAIADGVQCLLRSEIIRSHDEYAHLKYCPIYAKENLTRAYAAYHALGGNDVATSLYEQVMELPESEELE